VALLSERKQSNAVRLGVRRWLPYVAAVLFGFCWSAARAETSALAEYELKAKFLTLFAQFVEWTPEAFSDPDAAIAIGILGDDPFGDALERAVKKEAGTSNRKLTIKRSRRIEELKNCHLLFISKSEKDRLGQIFAALDGTPILTVSETEQFALRGGVINFKIQDRRVRFEINLRAATRARLKISPELLDLAEIVKDE
jgi:hypothetical protein